MNDRIKSMMSHGITGLKRVKEMERVGMKETSDKDKDK
jgi:hypothetical protein